MPAIIIRITVAKHVPGAPIYWVHIIHILTSKTGPSVLLERGAAKVLRRQKSSLLLLITDHLLAFSHSPRKV